MKVDKNAKTPSVVEMEAENARHSPRNLTPAQNALMTIKVLVAAGVLLAAIWGLNQWITSAD